MKALDKLVTNIQAFPPGDPFGIYGERPAGPPVIFILNLNNRNQSPGGISARHLSYDDGSMNLDITARVDDFKVIDTKLTKKVAISFTKKVSSTFNQKNPMLCKYDVPGSTNSVSCTRTSLDDLAIPDTLAKSMSWDIKRRVQAARDDPGKFSALDPLWTKHAGELEWFYHSDMKSMMDYAIIIAQLSLYDPKTLEFKWNSSHWNRASTLEAKLDQVGKNIEKFDKTNLEHDKSIWNENTHFYSYNDMLQDTKNMLKAANPRDINATLLGRELYPLPLASYKKSETSLSTPADFQDDSNKNISFAGDRAGFLALKRGITGFHSIDPEKIHVSPPISFQRTTTLEMLQRAVPGLFERSWIRGKLVSGRNEAKVAGEIAKQRIDRESKIRARIFG